MNSPKEYRVWVVNKSEFSTSEDYAITPNGVLLYNHEHDEYGRADCGLADRVNNFIVTDFTGLYDDNGVKIYEGDIIHKLYKCQDQHGKVSICEKSPDFVVEYRLSPVGFNITTGNNHGYKVVGNIYQNPELLHK